MKYVGNKSFMMFNNKMMELMELIKFQFVCVVNIKFQNKMIPDMGNTRYL